MDSKEYTQIREDLAGIKRDIANVRDTLEEFKEESNRESRELAERVSKLEVFQAEHRVAIESITNDHQGVIDSQRAIDNIRKFLLAIGTTAGGALVIALLNMIIEDGKPL